MFWRTGYDSRFSVCNAKTHHRMSKTKKSRTLAPWQLRRALAQLADEICDGRDPITVELSGNTIEIHLDGGSVNISVNQKGGAQ